MAAAPTEVTLRWTQVGDGLGKVPNYVLRYGSPTLEWASAESTQITIGGTHVGSRRQYTIKDLDPGTRYQFQVVAYRGSLYQDPVLGGLSNAASGITESTADEARRRAAIVVNPAEASLADVGTTLTLSATATWSSGKIVKIPDLTWQSLKTAAATVTQNGVVQAKAAGTALIVVSAACCGADTSIVTVQESAAGGGTIGSVTITPSNVTGMNPGDTRRLSADVKDVNGKAMPGATVTWSSSNVGIAAIDDSGLVTAREPGSVTIRATAAGKTATASVSVSDATYRPPSGGGGPNEPAGLTPIFSMDGTSKNWGPQWRYGKKWSDRVSVVTDPAAPSGKAVQVDWMPGDGDGFAGAAFWNWQRETLLDEVYIRVTFMYSKNWQQHASNTTKIFYYGAGSVGNTSQFYPQMNGTPGILRWRDQSGTGDDGVFNPATGGGVSLGVYHTLEIYHKAQSRVGASDGSVRIWLDGKEIQSWDWFGGPSGKVKLSDSRWKFIGKGDHPYFTGIQLVPTGEAPATRRRCTTTCAGARPTSAGGRPARILLADTAAGGPRSGRLRVSEATLACRPGGAPGRHSFPHPVTICSAGIPYLSP